MAGELILIVEDNEKNRKLERDILQFHGYRTVEADTAEEGIRLAQATPPALVLMHIQLPGMNAIVFVHVTDPVAQGFVKSLSHPGGNLTGPFGVLELPAKQIELFKELVPRLRHVLVLSDPEDPVSRRWLSEVRTAGATLKLSLVEREATDQASIERAFHSINPGAVDGVFIASWTLLTQFQGLILHLCTEHGLPLATHRKERVEQGALFSYGVSYASVGPIAAKYVDKILKGANPADLPVEEMSRFELVINLKTAKALGLTIPQSLLQRADQVIE